MLTQMRDLSQNWFGRAILALVLAFIIVSFAVWGIGDRFTNFNGNVLAKVGSTTITVDQFRDAFQNRLQQLQQQQKRAITNEEARRTGLDRQILARLLTDNILDQQAAKLGLVVGDKEIAQGVMRDPAFKGPSGSFDQSVFDRILQENGYSEASYARAQRGLTLRQDITAVVAANLKLPDIVKDAVHRYQSEVRDFDYFVLPPAAAGAVPAPSETELKSYYDGHPGLFTAPEYRKLVVLSIVPANLVQPDKVSDADVQRRYDEVKNDRYIQPEKRVVQQLVFNGEDAAKAAEAKLKSGASFDQVAKGLGKTAADTDLGAVTKTEIADHAVADAAFALPLNGTSPPVKGQFGTVIVHVTKIEPQRQQSLMEVSAGLKDEIAIIHAQKEATRLRDLIEDQRASGKTVAEAAAKAGLTARTIDAVDAQGRDKKRRPVEGLVAGPQLLKAAFSTDVGADTEAIRTTSNGEVWYEVAGIDPSRKLTLAEVKPQVEADWRRDETARRLAGTADKLVAAIDGGKPIATVAKENGNLALMHGSNVGRGGVPQLPSPLVNSFFDVVVGKAGSAGYGSQGRLVFKISAAIVPPISPKDEEFKKLLDQVQPGFEDDVLAQYLARVEADIGVTINQRALDTALGQSGS